MKVIEKMVNNGEKGTLIVSHGGILNALLRMVLGANPPSNGRGVYFQLGHIGYLHAEYAIASHSWIIKEFNPGQIFHKVT